MCFPMELRGDNEFARPISDSAADMVEELGEDCENPTEVLLDVLDSVMSSLADEWLADDGVHLAKMLHDKMLAEWNDEDVDDEGVPLH